MTLREELDTLARLRERRVVLTGVQERLVDELATVDDELATLDDLIGETVDLLITEAGVVFDPGPRLGALVSAHELGP